MHNNSYNRPQWSSYSSYILVTLGAVVGLGNIFVFPFSIVQFGGLFLLFYVLSEVFICIPLLLAEFLIGRRAKQNPVGAISLFAIESDANLHWRYIGWLCFIILTLSLSYYTVSVAFPFSYLVDTINSVMTNQTHLFTLDSANLSHHFLTIEICFLTFLMATLLVIVRGINRGLEGISWVTVPAYFIILLLLAIFTSFNGQFFQSLANLFYIPANQNIFPILLAAFSFAFFKLNIGMGSMMVYGSYLPFDVPLVRSTLIIVALDAVVSLLSYFIIAPLILQSQLEHPVLSYQNMIAIFTGIPYGGIIAILFFLAGVLAAWTVTIAMAESAVLILIERFQLSRVQATVVIGLLAIIVGTICVLSYTYWSEIRLFSTWSIAGFIKNFTSDLATPLAAVFIAIFITWIVPSSIPQNELRLNNTMFQIWHLLLKFLAPICIFIFLLLIGFN